MAARSPIEWTEMTWNPVTGCDQVSPGCDNCYALTLSKRLKAMGVAKYQNDGNSTTSGPGFAVTMHPAALGQPLRWRSPRTIFVNSMSDLFHSHVSTEFIRDVFSVMDQTQHHTYQVLTKRPLRAKRLANELSWPKNLWLGVSIENISVAYRVDHLRAVPVRTRFLSCEPLLGDLSSLDLAGMDWVIAGGESGQRSRDVDPQWVRSIRDLCIEESIPFFFKQWGGLRPKSNGRELDGRVWDEMPGQYSSEMGDS